MRWLYVFLPCFFVFSALASLSYSGSPLTLAIFNCTSLVLLLLNFVGRFSYSYFFLSLFLFLGFWLKFTVHAVVQYPFIEPVGDFDYSSAAWDRVLVAATVIFSGLIVARVMAALAGVGGVPSDRVVFRRAPRWYLANRHLVWVSYWVTAITVYGVNYLHGYFKVGVHSAANLPPVISAAIPFVAFIGLALVLAGLLGMELWTYQRIRNPPAIAVIVEGVMASASMASRAAFVMHVLPFLVAVVVCEKRWRRILLKNKFGFFLAALAALLVALGIVSLVRIVSYPGMSGTFSEQMRIMAAQSALLFVDRWIGLEGIMAVSASRETGTNLLLGGIAEDPKLGVNSLYQYISNSSYGAFEGFTFLSVPGFGAVLLYGGSYFLAFAASIIIGILLAGFERLLASASQNPFLVSLASAALANALCQMNFPYLFATFLVLLSCSCIILASFGARQVHRITIRGSP